VRLREFKQTKEIDEELKNERIEGGNTKGEPFGKGAALCGKSNWLPKE